MVAQLHDLLDDAIDHATIPSTTGFPKGDGRHGTSANRLAARPDIPRDNRSWLLAKASSVVIATTLVGK
jgi:hypothetical protein